MSISKVYLFSIWKIGEKAVIGEIFCHFHREKFSSKKKSLVFPDESFTGKVFVFSYDMAMLKIP